MWLPAARVLLACQLTLAVTISVQDVEQCPLVRPRRSFNLTQIQGQWFIVQYYSSREERPRYKCMRAHFYVSQGEKNLWTNFTYLYTDNPVPETIQGNLTWRVPDQKLPSHWIHSEDHYKGIYNTYVLKASKDWALLLHCAEKAHTARYLSSFLMSRTPTLDNDVINYLREQLPNYDVILEYMFPVSQENCGRRLTLNVNYLDSRTNSLEP